MKRLGRWERCEQHWLLQQKPDFHSQHPCDGSQLCLQTRTICSPLLTSLRTRHAKQKRHTHRQNIHTHTETLKTDNKEQSYFKKKILGNKRNHNSGWRYSSVVRSRTSVNTYKARVWPSGSQKDKRAAAVPLPSTFSWLSVVHNPNWLLVTSLESGRENKEQ